MKLSYPCELKHEDGEYLVLFRDFQEIITSGETEEQALEMASEALNTTVSYYLENERKIPSPSKQKRNEYDIHLQPSLALSLAIKLLRLKDGLTQAELANRLGVSQPMIRKLEIPNKKRKLETFINALDELGGELIVEVVEKKEGSHFFHAST